MKRLMIIVAMVLMGISGQAIAGSWQGVLGNYPSYGGYGDGIYYGSWQGVLGNYPSYGGIYYGRDRTLGRIAGYGGLAIGVLQVIEQKSVTDRVLSMAERDQEFRHQQIRAQIRTPRKKVLVGTDPAIYVLIPVDSQVKTKPEKTQEKKQQQDSIKTELQKEALELWREARTIREEARELEKKARRESGQEAQKLQKEAESKRKDVEALQKEAQDLWQKAKEQ